MTGLFLLGVLALIGWVLDWSGRRVAALLALGWLAGLIAATQPGLAPRFGGGVAGWLLWGGVLALVLCYRAGLGWLRARATPIPEAPPPETPPSEPPEDDPIERYSRHLILRDIGGPGQAKLGAARVLVIGAGGLGAPVLIYLAAAGVGHLTVVDDDAVSLSNLQRQIIHGSADLGRPKVDSAAETMAALNPHIAVTPLAERLTPARAAALFPDFDLILDGSDNFDTRYMVNRAAAQAGVPLIAGAIGQWEGQLSLYDPARGGPCYECVFPERPAPGLVPACAEAGVAAPLPGVIGAMMALAALRQITGAGDSLRGRLVLYDGLYAASREIRTKANPDCPACQGRGASV